MKRIINKFCLDNAMKAIRQDDTHHSVLSILLIGLAILFVLFFVTSVMMAVTETPTGSIAGTTYCSSKIQFNSCFDANPKEAKPSAEGVCCAEQRTGEAATNIDEFFMCVYVASENCP